MGHGRHCRCACIWAQRMMPLPPPPPVRCMALGMQQARGKEQEDGHPHHVLLSQVNRFKLNTRSALTPAPSTLHAAYAQARSQRDADSPATLRRKTLAAKAKSSSTRRRAVDAVVDEGATSAVAEMDASGSVVVLEERYASRNPEVVQVRTA